MHASNNLCHHSLTCQVTATAPTKALPGSHPFPLPPSSNYPSASALFRNPFVLHLSRSCYVCLTQSSTHCSLPSCPSATFLREFLGWLFSPKMPAIRPLWGGGLQEHMWGTDKHVAFSLNGSSEFHLCNQQLSWIPRLYSLKIFCKTNLETQVMMSTPQAPNCKGAFLIFHILRPSDLTRHYRLKLNVFNWENRQGARGLFARSEWGVPLIEI